MKDASRLLAVVLVLALQARAGISQDRRVIIRVKNDLNIARRSETIVLPATELKKSVQITDWKKMHVIDRASNQDLLTQAVDVDGDGAVDQFLFQSDFLGGETKDFIVTEGGQRAPSREQFKAYGRFVRERKDDFAWENDRVAHRMYGTALETWDAEPLTSSAVDVWCKRVRRLVVNDWYMVDNYHTDTGEGGDFYSAGRSRGCGGSGIWDNGKLFVSRNFINSRVIASGPIRVAFELIYAPWDVSGRLISEVKRITLDAGQNLNHFESFYRSPGEAPIVFATGIKKSEGSTVGSDRKHGWLRTWEPLQKGRAGNLGCGIVVDPALLIDITDADGDYLVVAKPAAGQPASYYAGFGWDRSGDFSNVDEWEGYLRRYASGLQTPLKISISSE